MGCVPYTGSVTDRDSFRFPLRQALLLKTITYIAYTARGPLLRLDY